MLSLKKLAPRSLAVQVPLIGVVLLTLAMGAYTWQTVEQLTVFKSAELQKRFVTLARNIATSSADSVLSNDYATLELVLLRQADYDDLVSVQVLTAGGDVVADVRRGSSGKVESFYQLAVISVPDGDTRSINRNESTTVIWHPILVSELAGWVRLEYSLDSIAHIRQETWKESSITSLAIILVFALLLNALFLRFMLSISSAAKFASELDGSRTRQIPVDTVSIETEELTNALNDASSRLYTANKNLSDQKFALDESSIVSISDKYGLITYVNDRFCTASGYEREDLIGLNHYFLSSDYYPEEYFDEIRKTLMSGEVWRGELKIRHLSGDSLWVDATIVPFSGESKSPYQFVSVFTDITERKAAESEMVKLTRALEQTADSIFITNTKGVIEYVNPAFEITTGYAKEEAIGSTPSLVRSGRHDKEFYRDMWAALSNGDVFHDVMINRKKSGELYYEEKTITPLKNDIGEITQYVSSGKDITERVEAEERLYYMAHHDVLTHLPNRTLFLDRLNHALKRIKRHDRIVAILFLDIDRFKVINDTLGHDAGDMLLKEFASRLTACVRDGDTVARLGGDEFTILLEDLANVNDIPEIIIKIFQALAKPITIENRELFVTTSIGISVAPRDGIGSNDLLKNADTAMYRSKEEGHNSYTFYSKEMEGAHYDRLDLETQLRYALERDQYVLHYQPQVNIDSGKVVGVEALVRWSHPEKGMVSPAEFIPLLEETGLIVDVGKWILVTACTQARLWQEAGTTPVRMSVNISARQFYDPSFIPMLDDVLEVTGIPPEFLELEITESVIMHRGESVIESLNAIIDRGVHLAIDDFGTGYSSLSYLKRFPIDTIKIDRSFVRDITTDTDDAEIVVAILAMARSLKLNVVAEGVETEEQLSFLKLKRCDVMQGFLFSKPIPAADVSPMLPGHEDSAEQPNPAILP